MALQPMSGRVAAPPTAELSVLGGCAAENRGADFVKLLALVPCARAKSLTGHRTLINQTASA
jgi:hypothetical protein